MTSITEYSQKLYEGVVEIAREEAAKAVRRHAEDAAMKAACEETLALARASNEPTAVPAAAEDLIEGGPWVEQFAKQPTVLATLKTALREMDWSDVVDFDDVHDRIVETCVDNISIDDDDVAQKAAESIAENVSEYEIAERVADNMDHEELRDHVTRQLLRDTPWRNFIDFGVMASDCKKYIQETLDVAGMTDDVVSRVTDKLREQVTADLAMYVKRLVLDMDNDRRKLPVWKRVWNALTGK